MALAKVAGRYGFISKGQCGPLSEVLVVVAEAQYRRRGRGVVGLAERLDLGLERDLRDGLDHLREQVSK